MNREIEKLFQKHVAGIASADEKKTLNDFIASNEGLTCWMEKEMGSMSPAMNDTRQSELLKDIHTKIKKEPFIKRPITRRLNAVAAIALIIISIGALASLIVYNHLVETQQTVIEAMRGQKTNITLPDGTKVTLNSDTKLSYSNDYNVKTRNVILHGEAFFDVAKNTSIPFKVSSGKLFVEAVGTAFNVRAYDNEERISTTLMEGEVNVKTPSETMNLLPNQRLEYNSANNTILKITLPQDARLSVGWLNNRLSFENATMIEVAHELSRCYNVDIVFKNENIKHQHFSGKINNNSLETVLRILSLTSSIQYTTNENTIELF